MVTLAIWFGYLAIGAAIARQSFIYTLGDSPRSVYKSGKNGGMEWSGPFLSAFWLAVFTLPLWPILGLLRLVTADTPHERTVKRAKELKELDAEMKRISRDYDFTFNK